MVAWEDAEFVSPYNSGACQMLVGDLDAQGDGKNPQVNGSCNGSSESEPLD